MSRGEVQLEHASGELLPHYSSQDPCTLPFKKDP